MKPTVNLSETYLYKIHTLSSMLDKAFDRALRAHASMTLSQCMVLLAIAQHGSLNQRSIARYLSISAAAVNRQVEIAKRTGWLRIAEDGNTRGESLQLTRTGTVAMQQSLQALEQHVFKIFAEHNRSANLMQHIELLLAGATEVLSESANTEKPVTDNECT